MHEKPNFIQVKQEIITNIEKIILNEYPIDYE